MKKIKIGLTIIIFLICSGIFFSVCFGTESNYDEKIYYNKIGRVTTEILKIRSGLGTENPYIGVLEINDRVNIYAKIDNWYIIKNEKNLVGAVCADYIEIENENIIETSNSIYEEDVILSQSEQIFLNLINKKRIENNLPELEVTEKLQNVARLKCKDLVENKYFSHNSKKYGNIYEMLKNNMIEYSTASENIAKSNYTESAVNLLMSSEKHKENILNSNFNYTGVAVQKNYDGKNIYVEIFVSKN